MDSVFDLCLIDTGLNPAEAGHCVATVGWLFPPTLPGGEEGRLNQLTPGISSTSVATLGRSFTCVGSDLIGLLSLICG